MERRRGERVQIEDPEKETRSENDDEKNPEEAMGRQSPGFPQQDEHEDVHSPSEVEMQDEEKGETEEEEESAVHVTSNLAAATAASTRDILRPLSEVAAQRSILLPTSGSLAWLATHQAGHADRGQKGDRDGSSSSSSSLMHGLQFQSDSMVDATTTTDISDVDSGGSNALGEFAAAVWRASTTTTTASEPIHSTPVYSSSPLSSPSSSVEGSSGLIEGSFSPEDQQQQQPPIPPSPFASIFPEGTGTYPLFIQRCDESEMHADSDASIILKYSESVQLFRRRPEDGGKVWKRRVLEYR